MLKGGAKTPKASEVPFQKRLFFLCIAIFDPDTAPTTIRSFFKHYFQIFTEHSFIFSTFVSALSLAIGHHFYHIHVIFFLPRHRAFTFHFPPSVSL